MDEEAFKKKAMEAAGSLPRGEGKKIDFENLDYCVRQGCGLPIVGGTYLREGDGVVCNICDSTDRYREGAMSKGSFEGYLELNLQMIKDKLVKASSLKESLAWFQQGERCAKELMGLSKEEVQDGEEGRNN